MDRFARLTFLARANAGRRRLPSFLDQLSRQVGHAISPTDVLPLERADALDAIITPIRRASRRQGPPEFSVWSPEAMTVVAPRLDSFLRAVATSLFLLPEGTLGIGPVRITAATVAPHIRALAEGETEECVLVTEDGLAGLTLYYHAHDHEHGEPHPYEMFVWGEPWRAAAVAELPFELAANAA